MARAATSGPSLIAAMMARYRQMRSYRDQGSVLSHLGDGEAPLEKPFDTAFAAPGLFRFRFDSPHPYSALQHLVTGSIVGCDGTRSYFHGPAGLEVHSDISVAVACATGISDGAAHTIARLLLPQVSGLALDQLREPSVVGELEIDGAACHRVLASHPRGELWELLVEKESLLLRRLSYGPTGSSTVQQRCAGGDPSR